MKQKPSDFDASLGRRLWVLRRRRTLTQAALGRRIGVSFQQIQKYECGDCSLTASRVYALACALEVPVEQLFPPVALNDGKESH